MREKYKIIKNLDKILENCHITNLFTYIAAGIKCS